MAEETVVIGLQEFRTNVKAIKLGLLDFHRVQSRRWVLLQEAFVRGAELPSLKVCRLLKQLEVVGAGLRTIPELPSSLRRLVLSKNHLHVLPELPESLQYLDISYNYIEELPPLPEVRWLNAAANRLHIFRGEECPKLLQLDLSGVQDNPPRQERVLDFFITEFPEQLKALRLPHHARITCPLLPPSLEVLGIHRVELVQESVHQLPALRKLELGQVHWELVLRLLEQGNLRDLELEGTVQSVDEWREVYARLPAELEALRLKLCEGVSLDHLPVSLRFLCTEAISVEELEYLPRTLERLTLNRRRHPREVLEMQAYINSGERAFKYSRTNRVACATAFLCAMLPS